MNAYVAALIHFNLKVLHSCLLLLFHKIIRNVMYVNAEEEKASPNYYTNKCYAINY